MPSTEERLTAVENSVLKLASNKLDTSDLSRWTSTWNAQYLDILSAVNNLKNRVDAIEQELINLINT